MTISMTYRDQLNSTQQYHMHNNQRFVDYIFCYMYIHSQRMYSVYLSLSKRMIPAKTITKSQNTLFPFWCCIQSMCCRIRQCTVSHRSNVHHAHVHVYLPITFKCALIVWNFFFLSIWSLPADNQKVRKCFVHRRRRLFKQLVMFDCFGILLLLLFGFVFI